MLEGNEITSAFPHGPVNHRRGITADGVESMVIRGNYLNNLDDGITILRSSGTVLFNNSVSKISSRASISFYESENSKISANLVTNCYLGVTIQGSSNMNISGNAISSCSIGVYVVGDHPTTTSIDYKIFNNTIERADTAIMAFSCYGCDFQLNNIFDSRVGIDLSLGAVFKENIIEQCETGIRYYKYKSTEIRNNSLVDNVIHVDARYGALDAKMNWWGSPDGPEPEKMVGEVIYEPWLMAQPGT